MILKGNRNYWTLIHLKFQRHVYAEDGESGSGNLCTGADGKDVIIDVPLGTVARDADTGETICEITKDEELCVAVKGGRGRTPGGTECYSGIKSACRCRIGGFPERG